MMIVIKRKFPKLVGLDLITQLFRKDFPLIIAINYDLFITEKKF